MIAMGTYLLFVVPFPKPTVSTRLPYWYILPVGDKRAEIFPDGVIDSFILTWMWTETNHNGFNEPARNVILLFLLLIYPVINHTNRPVDCNVNSYIIVYHDGHITLHRSDHISAGWI